MLTAFQCQIAGYLDEYGEVTCPSCVTVMQVNSPEVRALIHYDLESDEYWNEQGLYCSSCHTELVEPAEEPTDDDEDEDDR